MYQGDTHMYERMLEKQAVTSIADMTAYCGKNAELFALINEWLSKTYGTVQKIVFPYGNHYGWGIAHRKKKQLICNISAENNAFTVMVRLSNQQFESVYSQVGKDTQAYIANKYPCGDGGWIHCRVTDRKHFDDLQKLLAVKCTA